MVKILDTTLREGEQTLGVSFSVNEKIKIAQMLDDVGVDIIEAGHPSVSKKVYEAVKKIGNLGLKAETLAHIRPFKEDIDRAIDCNNDWVGILLPLSDIHLRDKLKITKEKALEIITEAIEYAKSHGLKVRYSPEDGSRTEINWLIEVCKKAEQAGADRISIIDTVGIETPENFYNLVKKVKENIKIPLNVHCHNDFGFALANSLAGIRAGATMVDVCVNGLGERAGIIDLTQLIMVLEVLEKKPLKYKKENLFKLSRYVEKVSGVYLSPLTPITGNNAFTHKSGIHTNGVLKNPKTYEAYDPSIIGRERKIVVDRYTGKSAVKNKLEEFGLKLSDEELVKITEKIKDFGDEHKNIHDTDILDIAEEVTGKKLVSVPSGVDGLVQIKLEPHTYTTSVLRKLGNIRGIGKILELAGEYEISAYLKAKDVNELNNLVEEIRAIPGVLATNTRIVLKKYENENGNNK